MCSAGPACATWSDASSTASRLKFPPIVERIRRDVIRLIDLHTDWLLQYAPETRLFDPALYPGIARRLAQSEGYLQGTSAAFLSCSRHPGEWARDQDPWSALGALLARCEAEF